MRIFEPVMKNPKELLTGARAAGGRAGGGGVGKIEGRVRQAHGPQK